MEIKELWNKGFKIKKICKELKCHNSTVKRWINREHVFASKSRNIRTILTESIKKKIEEQMRDKIEIGTRYVARALNADFESFFFLETDL